MFVINSKNYAPLPMTKIISLSLSLKLLCNFNNKTILLRDKWGIYIERLLHVLDKLLTLFYCHHGDFVWKRNYVFKVYNYNSKLNVNVLYITFSFIAAVCLTGCNSEHGECRRPGECKYVHIRVNISIKHIQVSSYLIWSKYLY